MDEIEQFSIGRKEKLRAEGGSRRNRRNRKKRRSRYWIGRVVSALAEFIRQQILQLAAGSRQIAAMKTGD